MKRKLLSQMRTEWRSNIWMCVELVIVGLVLWGVFTVFITLACMNQPPEHYSLENVYVGQMSTIPESASTYRPYPDSLHNILTDREVILNRLRSMPQVESIGMGRNAIPYNYNFWGTTFHVNDGDTVLDYMGNRRIMDPDMIRTIRLTGLNGETPEQLARLLEDGKIIVSTADSYDYQYPEGKDPTAWRGHTGWIGGDSADVKSIGAIIKGIRRTDYEAVYGGVLIDKLDPRNLWVEVAVRVKPGKGREFMESLTADILSAGNVYISNFRSVDSMREEAHRDQTELIRNLTACALFVMIAVFLGFLGAFWYRTQQRVPEMALRRVNGATRADLFRRLLSEGMLLLLLSAAVFIAIGWLLLIKFDELVATIGVPMWIFVTTGALSVVALALMIASGIAIPASKAMKINPAEALKDE